MTTRTLIFLAFVAAVSATLLARVGVVWPTVGWAARPLVAMMALAHALRSGADAPSARLAMAGGLGAAMVADLAWVWPGEFALRAGLGAWLVAHGAFVLAFAWSRPLRGVAGSLAGIVPVAAGIAALAWRTGAPPTPSEQALAAMFVVAAVLVAGEALGWWLAATRARRAVGRDLRRLARTAGLTGAVRTPGAAARRAATWSTRWRRWRPWARPDPLHRREPWWRPASAGATASGASRLMTGSAWAETRLAGPGDDPFADAGPSLPASDWAATRFEETVLAPSPETVRRREALLHESLAEAWRHEARAGRAAVGAAALLLADAWLLMPPGTPAGAVGSSVFLLLHAAALWLLASSLSDPAEDGVPATGALRSDHLT